MMSLNIGESQKEIKNLLLNKFGEAEADVLTRNLYLDFFDIDYSTLQNFKKQPLKATEHKLLLEMTNRLLADEPLQYVTGKAHFYNLIFDVNSSVLIPRPETEELVHWILSDYKVIANSEISILDIGTGSGCIAISLKKNLKKSIVYAFDVSEDALNTARQNSDNHDVEIKFIHQDILNNFEFSEADLLDVVVSNPPYVTPQEQFNMQQNVLKYEPHLALFVPQNDSLIFYKVIADLAFKKLKPGGALYFEINQYKAEETKNMLVEKGFEVILKKDMQGNFRMIKAWKK